MVTAYVMITASSGDADRIKDEISTFDGVTDAHIVAGDVDFIAQVDVAEPGDVKDIAAARIQGIDGIISTRTYIAMD
jgi:DNA-binding Lrp family transcriptional regulator